MGRGRKNKSNLQAASTVLGAQTGQNVANKLTLSEMVGGGKEAARKVTAKGAAKVGLRGAGAGGLAVTAAFEGFKAGKKIRKSVEQKNDKKIREQETQMAKNRARQAKGGK